MQDAHRIGLALWLLGGIIFLVTLGILSGFAIDLWSADLFYDSTKEKFLVMAYPLLGVWRDHGFGLVTCIVIFAVSLFGRLAKKPRFVVNGRIIIFLVSTLAIGPGLIVNGILKPLWYRPRPVQITDFGGNLKYSEWWARGCKGCQIAEAPARRRPLASRSFPSGEAASSTWMVAPAMFAPPQWRVAAYAGAAFLAGTVSLARMAAGAHFLTDVLIGAFLTLLVIYVMHRIIFRPRGTPANDPVKSPA